jgi:hypothetical protein
MARRPVHVDDQPGIPGKNRLCIEPFGQPAGDRGRPDIVGDVPFEGLVGQAQSIELGGNRIAGVIAYQKHVGAALAIDDLERGRIFGTQQIGSVIGKRRHP